MKQRKTQLCGFCGFVSGHKQNLGLKEKKLKSTQEIHSSGRAHWSDFFEFWHAGWHAQLITYIKYYVNRFMGLGVLIFPNLSISIGLAGRTYNIVQWRATLWLLRVYNGSVLEFTSL